VGQAPSLDLDEFLAESGRFPMVRSRFRLSGLLAPLRGRLSFLKGLRIGGDPALV